MKSTLTKQMLQILVNENISHYCTYMKKTQEIRTKYAKCSIQHRISCSLNNEQR